jgi:hypothetical protein
VDASADEGPQPPAGLLRLAPFGFYLLIIHSSSQLCFELSHDLISSAGYRCRLARINNLCAEVNDGDHVPGLLVVGI